MRGAIIKSGVVDNIIIADNPQDFGAVPVEDSVGIGWTYDGSKFTAPPVPDLEPQPTTYRISKTTPWRRMTAEEAAVVTGVLNETEARVQQIYQAATYLDSSDELWPVMWQILADAFGEPRANQLLAPET